MNPEEIVKKFFDLWNAYDVDGAVALLDSEVVATNPLVLQRKIGKEGARKGIAAINKAFPDLRMEITTIVAHGDTVAVEEVETASPKNLLKQQHSPYLLRTSPTSYASPAFFVSMPRV